MADRRAALGFHNHCIEVQHSDPGMAYRSVCSAVASDGDCAESWFLLGVMLRDMKNERAAVAAYRRGLACPEGSEPGSLNVALRHKLLVNLGHSLLNCGEFEAALRVTDQALEYGDSVGVEALGGVQGQAFAYTNSSLILSHMGLLDSSVRDARKGFELCADPMCEMGLAFALLFNGSYAEGLARFEARFPYRLKVYENMPYPKWDGSFVETLVVVPDQGLGDSLSFARFIPIAAPRVHRLVFVVQPVLVRLMRGALASFLNVEVVAWDTSLGLVPADAWCSVFSLPVALGLSDLEIAECPGLDPEDYPGGDALPAFRRPECEEHTLYIGIAWGGSPGSEIDVHRSIPVVEFLALLDVPGVRLFGLQVGDRSKDLHDAGCGALVTCLSPYIKDAADTAGLMRKMDLVICCESFVGHLAGALNVPCWIAASKRGRDWRIGIRGDKSLWYPAHRVIRQGDDLAWGPVFAEMCAELMADRNGAS